ncbi:MAG TPA: DUF4382 domain-containing protein [Candidatus Acidoferrales bacterium]|nr:DUF4382 domain-containing protein [Candidatus Acidoferrales bacterium]
MKRMRYFFAAIGVLALGAGLIACGSNSTGSGSNANPNPQTANGPIAIYGQDAPLASVITFQLTLMSVTASDGVNTTTLLSEPQTIDFARLTGLRTLLDLNSAPTGSYTSVTLMLASPVIGYINTSTNPPSVTMLDGTLTTSSVTVLMNPPLTITSSDLNGLRLDFDMRQSLQLDLNGQITGTVVPTFDLLQVNPANAEAEIDDLRGGVVTVNAANQSFVMQIANGKQITVQESPSTVTDSGDSLANFTSNTIVEVSGLLNRTTMNLDADEVCVLTQDHFIADGLITNVSAPTASDTDINLFVREALPANPAFMPDTIDPFDLPSNANYLIYRLNLPITQLLFNSGNLIVGQNITLGGPVNNSSLTVKRVVLHRQGAWGSWIPGTTMVQNGNAGSFQINEQGVLGVLLNNAALTVLTSNNTEFDGLSGLSALTGSQGIPLNIVGLLLQDPATGGPVLVAYRVSTP